MRGHYGGKQRFKGAFAEKKRRSRTNPLLKQDINAETLLFTLKLAL